MYNDSEGVAEVRNLLSRCFPKMGFCTWYENPVGQQVPDPCHTDKARKRMIAAKLLHDARVRVGALVFCCFLLGSTGWLAWLYNISALANPAQVDFYTMVLGYLAQAAGIGVYMLVRCKLGDKGSIVSDSTIVSIVMFIIVLEPATMTDSLSLTLAFGYAMNVFCGYFQGHYCSSLAEFVDADGRGTAFGAGYAATTLATWLLSSIADGSLVTGTSNLLVCALLALLAAVCVWWASSRADLQPHGGEYGIGSKPPTGTSGLTSAPTRSLLVLAGVTVAMISLVKNVGFSFPSADLSETVNLELSRLFYGVGLIAAGIVADRNRRYVLACCAASLVMPFLMLALAATEASSVTLWALGYLLFGFFTVFRVILFADLAAHSERIWLAGAGLALGRMGDAAGTALFLALGGSAVALIAVSAVLFVVSVALLFVLFGRLFNPPKTDEESPSETAQLAAFSSRYGLTERERDVLPHLLAGLTNARIASELGVSEPTVKFHVRNILKKTDCAKRSEVADLYRKS